MCCMICHKRICCTSERCWQKWQTDSTEWYIANICSNLPWKCSCCWKILCSSIKNNIANSLTPCSARQCTIRCESCNRLCTTIQIYTITACIHEYPSCSREIERTRESPRIRIEQWCRNRRSSIIQCLRYIEMYLSIWPCEVYLRCWRIALESNCCKNARSRKDEKSRNSTDEETKKE